MSRRIAVDHAERVAALMLIGGFTAQRRRRGALARRHRRCAIPSTRARATSSRARWPGLYRRNFFEEVVAQSLKMPARCGKARSARCSMRSPDDLRVARADHDRGGDQDASAQGGAGADGARDCAGTAERLRRHRPLEESRRVWRAICWRCCSRARGARRDQDDSPGSLSNRPPFKGGMAPPAGRRPTTFPRPPTGSAR